jgi:hypothetical protein
LPSKRILDATDNVANFPSCLIRFALALQLGIAGQLARNLFHFTFGFLA